MRTVRLLLPLHKSAPTFHTNSDFIFFFFSFTQLDSTQAFSFSFYFFAFVSWRCNRFYGHLTHTSCALRRLPFTRRLCSRVKMQCERHVKQFRLEKWCSFGIIFFFFSLVSFFFFTFCDVFFSGSRSHLQLDYCCGGIVRSWAADATVLLLCISLKWNFLQVFGTIFSCVMYQVTSTLIVVVTKELTTQTQTASEWVGGSVTQWRCIGTCMPFSPCATHKSVWIINQCVQLNAFTAAEILLQAIADWWHLFCYRFYYNFCHLFVRHCKFNAVYVNKIFVLFRVRHRPDLKPPTRIFCTIFSRFAHHAVTDAFGLHYWIYSWSVGPMLHTKMNTDQ